MKKKTGIKDIAAKAGVSIGTVDRVLHNRGEVKKETREKVLAIVEELNYKPNVLAQTLASKKPTRIAIVIPESSENNPYWKEPIEGIDKAIDELSSFNVQISTYYFEQWNEESFKSILQTICSNCPDGIIMNPIFKTVSQAYIKEFEAKGIPYIFMDVNIHEANNLSYFGQDAVQSGFVAAKLMHLSTNYESKYLIVKQSNQKVFSHHIEKRIDGFCRYFETNYKQEKFLCDTLEIDLLKPGEPKLTLLEYVKKHGMPCGIFIPNSRAFKVAKLIQDAASKHVILVGYDLVDENIKHLQNGEIDYLISQKPQEQAYKSIMALFNFITAKQNPLPINYSPIDIIVKENIEFYK